MPTGTLALLKARIADELARSDLTSQIADAINDAILIYQSERLRFNETLPLAPVTFATVAGTSFYDATSVPTLQTLFKFDYINVLIGNTLQELFRDTPQNIRMLLQVPGTQNGQPTSFALEGETLLLYPTPNQAWTLTLAAHFAYAAPAADDTANNRWMTDGERLIRARAKYEIAVHVTRNDKMARAMSPFEPEDGRDPGAAYAELKRLKGIANRYTGTGIIRPMQF